MKSKFLFLLFLFLATQAKAALSRLPYYPSFNLPVSCALLDSVPGPKDKENFLFVSGSIGGGDYPFAGFGLTLSHKSDPEGKSYSGIGVHYIGNTIGGEGALEREEYVQIIPIMLDYRREFSQSASGKFSTYLFLDAGYVFTLTGNEVDQTGEYEYKNGWAINPGISFKFDVFRQGGFMLDLGWMHHSSRLKWLPPSEQTGRKKWNLAMARLSLFF